MNFLINYGRFLFDESSSVHHYYKEQVNLLHEAINLKKHEERAIDADTEDNKGIVRM